MICLSGIVVHPSAITAYENAIVIRRCGIVVHPSAITVYPSAVLICLRAITVYPRAIVINFERDCSRSESD